VRVLRVFGTGRHGLMHRLAAVAIGNHAPAPLRLLATKAGDLPGTVLGHGRQKVILGLGAVHTSQEPRLRRSVGACARENG